MKALYECMFYSAFKCLTGLSYMHVKSRLIIATAWRSQALSDIIACAYNSQTNAVQVVDTWVDANNAVLTDSNYVSVTNQFPTLYYTCTVITCTSFFKRRIQAYLCNQSAGTYGGGRMSCRYVIHCQCCMHVYMYATIVM